MMVPSSKACPALCSPACLASSKTTPELWTEETGEKGLNRVHGTSLISPELPFAHTSFPFSLPHAPVVMEDAQKQCAGHPNVDEGEHCQTATCKGPCISFNKILSHPLCQKCCSIPSHRQCKRQPRELLWEMFVPCVLFESISNDNFHKTPLTWAVPDHHSIGTFSASP